MDKHRSFDRAAPGPPGESETPDPQVSAIATELRLLFPLLAAIVELANYGQDGIATRDALLRLRRVRDLRVSMELYLAKHGREAAIEALGCVTPAREVDVVVRALELA